MGLFSPVYDRPRALTGFVLANIMRRMKNQTFFTTILSTLFLAQSVALLPAAHAGAALVGASDGECAGSTVFPLPLNPGSPDYSSRWRGLDVFFSERGQDISPTSPDFSLAGVCYLNTDMPNREPSPGLVQISGAYAVKQNKNLVVLVRTSFSWNSMAWPLSNPHCEQAQRSMKSSGAILLKSSRVSFDFQNGYFTFLLPAAISPQIYHARTVPGGIILRAGWDEQKSHEHAVYCAFPDPSSSPAKREYCLDSMGILRDGKATSTPQECDKNRVFLFEDYAAHTVCPQGTRPPSIRELAEMAKGWGAQGIWRNESGAVVRPDLTKPGYNRARSFEVLSVSEDGSREDFYYSEDGYKAPRHDFESSPLIQSSSIHEERGWSWYFDPQTGRIRHTYPQTRNAVMCVSKNKQ
jgi:hypothetical protein